MSQRGREVAERAGLLMEGGDLLLDLLEEQASTRVPELRFDYGRMAASPFAFC